MSSPKKARFTVVATRSAIEFCPLSQVATRAPNAKVNIRGAVHFKSLQGRTKTGAHERVVLQLVDNSSVEGVRVVFYDDAMSLVEHTCANEITLAKHILA